jgi:hypothetical protein
MPGTTTALNSKRLAMTARSDYGMARYYHGISDYDFLHKA